jgi:hypothetical protein
MKIKIEAGNYGGEICVEHQTKVYLDDLNKDRTFVIQVFNNAILEVIKQLEENEVINPKPKDDPCCKRFEDCFDDKENKIAFAKELKFCPFCKTAITDERKNKYLVIKD